MLICNGGEMEQWVEQVLGSLDTSHMKVLDHDGLWTVVEEEHVEGMEEEEHRHEDGFEMHIEYDEHIWTSPCQCPGHCKNNKPDLVRGSPREKAVLRIIPRHT